MKTAVEWLVQQLSKEWQLEDRDLHLIQQANKMFEEQIKEAHFDGKINGMDISHPLSIIKEITATEYYNETFKSE
jgi:hypothetical protein